MKLTLLSMWNHFDRGQSGITRVAGICGIFIPVVIFTCLWLSIASSPWFTWTQHALSDLGIQANTAALFNYGMILGGILTLIFSLGLIKILSNKIGAYLLAVSSRCSHRNWFISGNFLCSSFYYVGIVFCASYDCFADHWTDHKTESI